MNDDTQELAETIRTLSFNLSIQMSLIFDIFPFSLHFFCFLNEESELTVYDNADISTF